MKKGILTFIRVVIVGWLLVLLSPWAQAKEKGSEPLKFVAFQGPQQKINLSKTPLRLYQDSVLTLDLYYPSRQAETKARLLKAYAPNEAMQRNRFYMLRFHPASCDVFTIKSTLKGQTDYALNTVAHKPIVKIPQGHSQLYFVSVCLQNHPSAPQQRYLAIELVTPQKKLTLEHNIEPFSCKQQYVSAAIQQHLDEFERPIDILGVDMELLIREAKTIVPSANFWQAPLPDYNPDYQKDQTLLALTRKEIEYKGEDAWQKPHIFRKSFTQLATAHGSNVLQCITDFQHEQLLERVEVLRQKSEWLHHLPQSPSIEDLSALDNLLRHFFFRINTLQGVNDYYAVTQKSNS